MRCAENADDADPRCVEIGPTEDNHLGESVELRLTEREVRAWSAAAGAWLAVQMAYAPFDDGTKHAKPRPDNSVRRWALRLFDALHQLPLAPAANDTMRTEEHVARQAVALRDVATHLPELAEHLRDATARWGERGCLLAPARRLARFDLTNHAAVPHEPVALVTAADLIDVRNRPGRRASAIDRAGRAPGSCRTAAG